MGRLKSPHNRMIDQLLQWTSIHRFEGVRKSSSWHGCLVIANPWHSRKENRLMALKFYFACTKQILVLHRYHKNKSHSLLVSPEFGMIYSKGPSASNRSALLFVNTPNIYYPLFIFLFLPSNFINTNISIFL